MFNELDLLWNPPFENPGERIFKQMDNDNFLEFGGTVVEVTLTHQ